MQKGMLASLETRWRDPDEGIWEVRGPPRHFTFSKIMAWTAFDRCIATAERFGFDELPLIDVQLSGLEQRLQLSAIALVRFRGTALAGLQPHEIVRTSAARLTIDAAIVDRIAVTAVGSPTTLPGSAL